MRNAMLSFVLAACDGSTTPPPAKAQPAAKAEPIAKEEPVAKEDPPQTAGLAWTIETQPARVTKAQLEELRIRITVTNNGTAPADATRHPLHFTVDGEPSTSLSLAFGNGGRSAVWKALPPGESIHDDRVGVSFVDVPGEHVIAISDGTTELARTTVELVP